MFVFRPIPRGIRGYRIPRCKRCWMEATRCICPRIPRLATRTRVVIVMPWNESSRPSNTGRLAHLVLENSEIRCRGVPGHPFRAGDLLRDPDRVRVLFPDEEADVLTPGHDDPAQGPLTLVVPDGTWRQARRCTRNEPDLRGLPRVKLPPGSPSVYRLRKRRAADELCTYESIARALGILEGDGIAERMMPTLDAMMESCLGTKGERPRG
jgi:DTW domain-containing protein YfiP